MCKKHNCHKILFCLFLLSFASVKLIAQQKIKPNGHNTFYYKDGKKSSEGNMLNGKPVGLWKTFFENGKIKSVGNRKNYKLDSVWCFYNEKGFIQKKLNYKNGLLDSISSYYSDSGLLLKQQNYVKNILQGNSYLYYKSKDSVPHLKALIPYKDGLENGKGFEYAEDGRIITIINYQKGSIANREFINRYNKGGKKEGEWKTFYKNGRLKTEATYYNGELNGYYKFYDEKGNLKDAKLYVNGKAVKASELETLDIKKEYYPSGKIKIVGTINLAGEKQGQFKYFDENGKLNMVKLFYQDTLVAKGLVDSAGKRIGNWEMYYTNGKLKAKGEYKLGHKFGNWKYYYADSQLQQEGKYILGGKEQGNWIWYYPDGAVLRNENYIGGLRDGDFTEFLENGDTISRGTYLSGLKDGDWYYHLNDHTEIGKYQEDNRTGAWKFIDTDTKKTTFKGTYFDGLLNGYAKYYYPNGRLRLEGNYINGNKDGEWKSYDTFGALKMTQLYANGRELKIDGVKVKPEGP